MKLGVMQPYFFPYLGYFDLINRTDQWVVFDTPQYVRHSWMNRNRILHPKKGWQYILVPLKKHYRTASLREIEISNPAQLRGRILGQIAHYNRRAPFFRETASLVADSLEKPSQYLVKLNVDILERICRYLQIPFRYTFFSEMDKLIGPVKSPGDWALEISKTLGAQEYINPPGGEGLFDRKKFREAGIKLTITNLIDFKYECPGCEFISHLSIIDVLMWNHPRKVKEFLDSLKSKIIRTTIKEYDSRS